MHTNRFTTLFRKITQLSSRRKSLLLALGFLSVSTAAHSQTTNVLVGINATQMWRYENTGRTDLGTGWKEAKFNDSAWPQGAALLAFETGATAEPIRTQLKRTNSTGGNIITDYFRTRFTFSGNPAGAKLFLRHVVDDGVAVYLNGTEVHRFFLPTNAPITASTLAVPSDHENRYEGPFEIPASLLVVGENVIAAEVHQSSATSSDVVFGLELTAVIPPPPPTAALFEFEFNEGTGNTVTSKDKRLVGTFGGTNGVPKFSTDTPSGAAGDFSLQFERGQQVVVPDPTKVLALETNNPSFTIQAWLKFATPAARSVFFYNNGPGGAVSASVFTNRTAFVTTLGIVDQRSNAVIPDDGQWHHMAVVHDFAAKQIRFYVDGVLGDTISNYTRGTIFTRTNQVFYIGSEPTGGLQYVGLLDRLRYSRGALSQSELDSNPGKPAPQFPAPIAYEGFSYPTGAIIGVNGGSGWANAWQANGSPANSTAVQAGSLEYTDAKGNSLITSGGKAYITGAPGTSQPNRDLPVVLGTNGTTVWFSFLGYRTGPTTNNTATPGNIYPRAANVSLFNSTLASSSEQLAIGSGTGATNNAWALLPDGSLANRQPSNVPFDRASFIVVRIDYKDGNDDAYLWVDPALDVVPDTASAAARSVGAFDFSFNRVRPFAGNPQPNDARPHAELVFDELRIGTTYASVAPYTAGRPKYALGLNFGANEIGGEMRPQNYAGVPDIAQHNWNNLAGQNGTNVAVVANSSGTAEPVPTTVSWVSNGTWASVPSGTRTENNAAGFTGTDRQLILGYLDTGNATTTRVTISNVPPRLLASGYDVVVYALGGVAGRGGGYRIYGATTNEVLKDYVRAQSIGGSSNYVQVPVPPSSGTHGAGNYIYFSGLTARTIIVEATTQAGQAFGGTPRAPINAIQLIPTPAPAPPVIAQQPASVTINEGSGRTATFSVVVSGRGTVMYQWQRNGVNIPGATNATYTTPAVIPADNGAVFNVVVSNAVGSVKSADAVLTVVADTTAPTLVSAQGSASLDAITLRFSEPLSAATATNVANYAISGGVTVTSATLLGDGSIVRLTTSKQTPGTVYTVTVTGLKDTSFAGNQVVANTRATVSGWVLTRGFAYQEFYRGITGTLVTNLTLNPKFPNAPDDTSYGTLFEVPVNAADNYGVRMSALLTAPETGNYTFYISADDQAEVYLSTDEDPAKKVLIAREPQWNNARQWLVTSRRTAANPENRSAPITLEAGKRYYMEALMKEGGGGDNLAVAWQLPSQSTPPANGSSPITGQYLLAFADPAGATLTITRQPTNTTVVERSAATFSVAVTGSTSSSTSPPVFYQWSRNGQEIPGANSSSYTTGPVTPANSGEIYSVLVSIPGRETNSANAILTVTRDVTPPTLVSAKSFSRTNKVNVVFSEPVADGGALNPKNYTIDNAVTVTAATRIGPAEIEITTSTLSAGRSYTLTVNGVRDLADQPNTIALNSRIPIDISPALPAEFGQLVSGYQDDFLGRSLAPAWVARGPSRNIYSVTNGVLRVATATGDPNHLLYEVPGYNPTNQEVLVRIRMLSFTNHDLARGGIGVGVDTNSRGMNFLFRDGGGNPAIAGRHVRLLDDGRSWGPTGFDFRPVGTNRWQTGEWYWMRLRQVPNTAAGQPDAFGKVWLADGTTPEPADFQISWDRYPAASVRSGFAGITAGSGAETTFEVDYILIKASGLPTITASGSGAIPVTAVNDTIETLENTAVTISAAKLAANDTGGGGPLTVTAVSAASAQGGAVRLVDGQVTYTPRNNFRGSDTFTYTVAASGGGTATGTVNVTVVPGNAPSQNLVSITRADFGVIVVQFSGIPGRTYTIQASSDLNTWTNIGTATANQSGAITFIDPEGGRFAQRFYRTVAR